jgi:multicomponent Na+:H+ antiporter subunit B
MNSPVLAAVARLLKPLLLVFSVYVLLRGHNDPGGGFVGGLIAASAFALSTLALGVEAARRALAVPPASLIAVGLLLAAASGAAGLLRGEPYLTSVKRGVLSTVLVFDIGVYLAVAGVTLLVVFTLAEDAE